jgi:two-component system NtrC family sensor kinase
MTALIKADREKAALDASLMQSSKMAALGKMAAGIAHEVNNPLAVIKEKVGWLKDLLSEEDVAASENFSEFSDALNKIENHVERAKKVTHRLLGFARRMEPTEEKVDINKVLSDTLSFLENDARYKNIAIKTSYAPTLPPTLSDSAQIQQVFLNILNNAIDAIGKDGEIQINTARVPRKKRLQCASTITVPACPMMFSPGFSILSSPPKRWGMARVWVFPSATALSRNSAAESWWPARLGRERPLRFTCRCGEIPTAGI